MAENYQLKWHSHGAYLHTSIATLQRSQCFTDVTLCTLEGKCLMAHRFVLSACSSYFDKLLQQAYSLSHLSPLFIVLPPEVSYQTLSVLLQYMYSGEATVANSQLNNVLKAGEILKVTGILTPQNSKDNKNHSSRKDNTKENAKVIRAKNASQKASITNLTNGAKFSSDVTCKEKPSSESMKSEPMDDELVAKVIQEGPETQIVIKEEPLEWDNSSDVETHMTIQPVFELFLYRKFHGESKKSTPKSQKSPIKNSSAQPCSINVQGDLQIEQKNPTQHWEAQSIIMYSQRWTLNSGKFLYGGELSERQMLEANLISRRIPECKLPEANRRRRIAGGESPEAN
ncbi:hypothetical protein ACFE04_008911 [Oxalis oulophora]